MWPFIANHLHLKVRSIVASQTALDTVVFMLNEHGNFMVRDFVAPTRRRGVQRRRANWIWKLVCHHISHPSYGVCLATPWRLIVRSIQRVLCWPHAIVVVITMGWSRFFTFLSGLKWLALCGNASVRCLGYLIGSLYYTSYGYMYVLCH